MIVTMVAIMKLEVLSTGLVIMHLALRNLQNIVKFSNYNVFNYSSAYKKSSNEILSLGIISTLCTFIFFIPT